MTLKSDFQGTERFKILSRLGQGGMGVVYHVYDREQKTRLALKTILRLDAEILARFKQEFRMLQDLQHPNLVSLGEFIEHEGQWFFTMEHVDGVDFLDFVVDECTDYGQAPNTSQPIVRKMTSDSESSGNRGGRTRPPRARVHSKSTPLVDNLDGARSQIVHSPADPVPQKVKTDSPSSEPDSLSNTTLEVLQDSPVPAPFRREFPQMDPKRSSPTPSRPIASSIRLPSNSDRIFPTPFQTRVQFDEAKLRNSIAQVAQGLFALHSVGKVHRDIKPSNILITKEGRVVILDFGLVTSLDHERRQTSDGAVGTYLYMSPEQGASRPVDEKTDWYSFGIILYQALTGTRPFKGPGPQVLMHKQSRTPPSPRSLSKKIPEDLSSLCDDLLQIDPRDRPSGREILRRLHVDLDSLPEISRDSHRSRHGRSEFVGRRTERALLQDAFENTIRHRAETVLISGESGVGKTALVRQFAEDALAIRSDALVLTGRCYQQESVPFKAFDGVIDQICEWLRGLNAKSVEMYLPRNAALLAKAFPVLRRVDAIAEAPQTHATIRDPQELRSRVFRGIREIFHRISERHPVIVVIDDLQWSDSDSLAMLAELMRPPDAPPMLLLATARTGGNTGLAAATAATMMGEHRDITLGPLSPEESRELARQLLATSSSYSYENALAIAEECGGHPLFIDTLVRHVSTQGSPTEHIHLDEAIWRQITRLDAPNRHLLELIATAGFPINLEVAAAATSFGPVEFSKGLKSLRLARLIRTDGKSITDSVEPYHDRIREAIAERLDFTSQIQHHRSLARALESSGKIDPEKLSHHWHGAGNREKAVRYAIQAGERASEALAFDRAAEFYHMAISLGSVEGTSLQELMILLGDSLANGGKGAEAASVYQFAVHGATPSQALDLNRQVAEQLLTSGHFDEGIEAFKRVFAMQNMRYPKTPAGALLRLVGLKLWLMIRGRHYTIRDPSEVSEAERTRIDTCWAAVKGLGGSDIIRGQVFQARGLLLALRSGEPYRIARALAMEKPNLAIERPRATKLQARLTREAEELAEISGIPHAHGWVLFSRGSTAFIDGRRRKALEHFENAETIFRTQCTGVAWELSTIAFLSLDAMAWTGAWRELAQRAPRALQDAKDRGDLYATSIIQAGAMCFAHLIADEPKKALLESERAIEQWSSQGFHAQHQNYLRHHVLADLYQGNSAAASDCIESNWPALRRSMLLRVPFMRITLLHARAVCALALAVRFPEQHSLLLEKALEQARKLERERRSWAHPMAHSIYATAAILSGDTERGIRFLERALQGFHAEGLAGMEAAARRRLGELIGGPDGEDLINSADDWMKFEGVKNPERMTAALLPGFPDSTSEPNPGLPARSTTSSKPEA